MDWEKSNIRRRLHGLLKHRGWKHQDAEDIIQDAFLRMQAYCNEGGQVRNSEAFLVRTALNLSANSRARNRPVLYVEEAVQDPALVLGLAPSPDEEMSAEQSLSRVISLIDAMTSRTQEIFLLHYLDDYTYPQIAQQLGISVSAIEKHIARAMLALTQEFKE